MDSFILVLQIDIEFKLRIIQSAYVFVIFDFERCNGEL